MTEKEKAQRDIQMFLGSMMDILEKCILPLAREHQIEFSFMGMTYHLFPRNYERGGRYSEMEIYNTRTHKFRYVPRPPAQEGLLVADDEWQSSSFSCTSRYWKWYEQNWPELEEDVDDEV